VVDDETNDDSHKT
jgi:hypothetical protein